jgi:hypothetical protein
MSTFDAEIFAQAALADARDALGKTTANAADVAIELQQLEQDIEATLAALEVEKDVRRAQALRQDLAQFLPARKAAILSAAASTESGEVQAALENALTLATRAAVIVAKAFVASGGL